YGKDGKDNSWNEDVPEDTNMFPGEPNWSELEPLYRLDEHAYDLKLNFTLSLEDWAHFSRSVDHMFTLLSNDNQPTDKQEEATPWCPPANPLQPST
ncbi:hypothetical protein M9458_046760, partial [Cirrhinus mrigala]